MVNTIKIKSFKFRKLVKPINNNNKKIRKLRKSLITYQSLFGLIINGTSLMSW